MTPRELIRSTGLRFLEIGIPDPRNDSALLLSFLLGRRPLELCLDSDTELDEDVLFRFEELVRLRMQRIPLQYILGETPFCGRLFLTDHRALIPRPETELLCEWSLEALKNSKAPRILDLCTGTGCIGLTIAAERPDALVTLSDISAEALSLAGINAGRLHVTVSLHHGDLFEGFGAASFDMIVCNPPYIPSGECSSLQPEVLREPLIAHDGGPDGLEFYRRLIPEAGKVLPSGGKLLLETGFNQAERVSVLLADHGFIRTEVRRDLSGISRMVLATNH